MKTLPVLALVSFTSLAGCSLAAKLQGGGSAGAPPAGPTEAATPAADPAAPSAESSAPAGGEGDPTGIPEILVQRIRESYSDSASRENNYAMLRGAARAFGPAWGAYQARKNEVDKVMVRAAALEKAGKLAEAEAALAAVLRPVPAGGPQWSERRILEPADAEWPALLALARIAVARRSAEHPATPIMLRVAGALWGRRPAGDRDAEVLVWLAQCIPGEHCKEEFKSAADRMRAFSTDPVVGKAIDTAGGAAQVGRKQAIALLHEVLAKGIHPRQATAQLHQLVINQSGYERWPKLFDESTALVKAFQAGWQAYAERRAAVAAAVAEAEQLEKAGKLDDARARLQAVITAPVRDPAGELPLGPRRFVEARDAELPAVEALARVLRARKDLRAYIELGAAYWVRRKIGGADAELAAHILRGGTLDYDGQAYDEASGRDLAIALWRGLPDLGLAAGAPEAEMEVGRGKPMLLVLPAKNWQNQARTLTVAGRSVKFKMTIDANDKRCRVTNRVDRIEDDGTVRYQEECTYTPKKIHYTAEAALAEPAPAWAGDAERIHVFGILARDGGPRSWKLEDAVILDLRFHH